MYFFTVSSRLTLAPNLDGFNFDSQTWHAFIAIFKLLPRKKNSLEMKTDWTTGMLTFTLWWDIFEDIRPFLFKDTKAWSNRSMTHFWTLFNYTICVLTKMPFHMGTLVMTLEDLFWDIDKNRIYSFMFQVSVDLPSKHTKCPWKHVTPLSHANIRSI